MLAQILPLVNCTPFLTIDGDEPSFLRFDSGSEIVGVMDHSTSFDCSGSNSRRNGLAYPQDLSQHGTIDTIVLRHRCDLTFRQRRAYMRRDCLQSSAFRCDQGLVVCQDSGSECILTNWSGHYDMHPLSVITRLLSTSLDLGRPDRSGHGSDYCDVQDQLRLIHENCPCVSGDCLDSQIAKRGASQEIPFISVHFTYCCFEPFHCCQSVSSLSRFSLFALLDHCHLHITHSLYCQVHCNFHCISVRSSGHGISFSFLILRVCVLHQSILLQPLFASPLTFRFYNTRLFDCQGFAGYRDCEPQQYRDCQIPQYRYCEHDADQTVHSVSGILFSLPLPFGSLVAVSSRGTEYCEQHCEPHYCELCEQHREPHHCDQHCESHHCELSCCKSQQCEHCERGTEHCEIQRCDHCESSTVIPDDFETITFQLCHMQEENVRKQIEERTSSNANHWSSRLYLRLFTGNSISNIVDRGTRLPPLRSAMGWASDCTFTTRGSKHCSAETYFLDLRTTSSLDSRSSLKLHSG